MFYFTGGSVLEGFNIVGDGTTHNLNALLNGHRELDMFETRRGIPGRKLSPCMVPPPHTHTSVSPSLGKI